MDIQMLGCGSAFAKTFYNNNAIVYAGGKKLLIDCGTTAPLALHRLGMSLAEVDAFLISHIHADHIGGLEEVAFQYKFLYQRKPTLYIADTLPDLLWERSLRGGLEQEELHRLEDYFDLRPLREGEKTQVLPGLTAELLRTTHIPDKRSYSILLNDTFFYTADMVFDPDLLQSLVLDRGVETIFHDCQLHPPGVVHACLPQLLTLPEELQRRIYLMHYGDAQPEFVGRTGQMTFVEQQRVYSF
ncbi:MBL fold metallo-hydrolase [Cohnella nanjingensis]|uniref:MBL fold metallo-hydrolase n=1 Tax=Cohnella nanjingensis TaxID=1387779 RepID=A0A7X0VFY4_9BACL|nr:MBL fold metallo-hydrolase [Cohnella nanjingensis]MBB6671094.1 MBL fold metallo-hydrolase [Cohnella nanjingensis]